MNFISVIIFYIGTFVSYRLFRIYQPIVFDLLEVKYVNSPFLIWTYILILLIVGVFLMVKFLMGWKKDVERSGFILIDQSVKMMHLVISLTKRFFAGIFCGIAYWGLINLVILYGLTKYL